MKLHPILPKFMAATLILGASSQTFAAALNGVEMIGVTDGNGVLTETVHYNSGFTTLSNLTASSGLPIGANGAALQEDDNHGLQVVAFNDLQFVHAIRDVNGTWTAWGDVYAAVGKLGPVRKAVLCAMPGEMQLLAVTYGGGLFHTVGNNTSGAWTGWGDVRAFVGGHGPVVDVGCASDYPDQYLQVAMVTSDGGIWHALRYSDGSWTAFGDVVAANGMNPGRFTAVSMTQDRGNMQLMASTEDGGIWHTIRFSDGSWQGWGWVQGQTGPLESGGILQLSATVGYAGAEFTVLKISGIPWWTTRHDDGTWTAFQDLRAFFGNVANFIGWNLDYYY
ncbi:MAG: hypothetical protein JOY71_15070 [Acetobacteraceae bacterium]|nr:hypothetical protein [Acetobacteraceae bacterium]